MTRQSRTQGPTVGDEKGSIEVLLVGDGPQAFALTQQRLETRGFRCRFAKSQNELKDSVKQRQFHVVLAMRRIEGSSTDWLGTALLGSRSSLFYLMPVEVGCWWVPVLRMGLECSGTPAFRQSEFSDAIEAIVDEMRTPAATILNLVAENRSISSV